VLVLDLLLALDCCGAVASIIYVKCAHGDLIQTAARGIANRQETYLVCEL
jgi:hypothetical protein